MANRLALETSPYLLQHANNPVDWHPWGEEALTKAREQDRPILVSIGYAACHWCHVMERESFENEETAVFMNAHFVNIKIDREERPDLDHIYMDAVQAMSGNGGWPLNVFLTPDGRPFYGGTYYPPKRAFNRSSWMEVLDAVSKAYLEKREEIETQAANLTEHLVTANSFGLQQTSPLSTLLTPANIYEAYDNLMKSADREWGGFGRAPKFPQTFSIQFLLRFHWLIKNQQGPSVKQVVDASVKKEGEALRGMEVADDALKQAILSLDKMIEGGIYDQVGGGFSRYSTDTEWLAPHFEKMLYDNALLVSAMSEAYQVTREEKYRETIEHTMAFIRREMTNPGQAFFAALDADSEGEEGKFYVWEKEAIDEILGKDAETMGRYFDVGTKGNWEGKTILRTLKPLERFAGENGLSEGEMKKKIRVARERLLSERNKRIRPQLDDKIILGWNALMNTACSKAFAATGEEEYRRLAVDNMKFLMTHLAGENPGQFFHTWKSGQARYPAFLDDYAYLIQALIQLQEITMDSTWLDQAKTINEWVVAHFSEEGTGYFYFTGSSQSDVIMRKKEVYDGATPSGNAIMAGNLNRLGVLFDRPDWRERSGKMLSGLGEVLVKHPTSFGCWNNLLLELGQGLVEIAIVGPEAEKMLLEILKEFIPNKLVMATTKSVESFPLLKGKQVVEGSMVYVCRNFSCKKPVGSTKAAISLIHNETKHNNFMLIQ